MKSKGWMTAFALIAMTMASAAKADVVVDQSRVSVVSPMVPLLDQATWPGMKWRLVD